MQDYFMSSSAKISKQICLIHFFSVLFLFLLFSSSLEEEFKLEKNN